MKRLFLVMIAILMVIPLWAQEGGSEKGFSAGLNLGTDLLPNPDTGVMESWSKLGLRPDLALGKFGVGLDLTLRFQLYPDPNDNTKIIRVYEPDWIPQAGSNVFDLYLPKILYVRYGLREVDPIYVKLGSISDFSLGNGLIVSDYANTRFLPDRRIFGLQLGVDGAAFRVPYIGMEVLTGNLTKFDVIGGRVYLRPLAFLGKSLLGRLQVGATAVLDQDPLLYFDNSSNTYASTSPAYVLGADLTLPLLTGQLISLVSYVEGAREMNDALGAVAGIRGRVLGFIRYGAEARYFQEGFIPAYFDTNYDLYRAERFDYIQTTPPGDFNMGWLAKIGFDLFQEKILFTAALDGPLAPIPSVASDNASAYPHLKGSFFLKEGLIGGISFSGNYEKYFIGRADSNVFADLINPTDAVIGMDVNYKTGATLLTLHYTYKWDPSKNSGAGGFDVSSSLSVSVQF
ncbi:MAG: hypothetical protein FD137_1114 [Spirochaetes bacterium]|nr:MAG: hypothetical protein FD137_1114 [Spirochaetota bacterium]